MGKQKQKQKQGQSSRRATPEAIEGGAGAGAATLLLPPGFRNSSSVPPLISALRFDPLAVPGRFIYCCFFPT